MAKSSAVKPKPKSSATKPARAKVAPKPKTLAQLTKKNGPAKRPVLTAQQIFDYNQMMHKLEEQRTYQHFKTGETPGVPKTAKQWTTFLMVLSETAMVSKACVAANITRNCAFDRKRDDAEFAKLWEEAYDRGYLKMEEEVQRRAFEGTRKPQYRNGQLVDWSHDYSDALAVFLLKGRMRKIYGDKQEITVNNANRPYAKLSDEEIEALLAKRLEGEE